MLKNYLILTFKHLADKKFYTSIMLIGISITIFFVCIGIWFIDIFTGTNPPSVNRMKNLYLQDIQIYEEPGGRPRNLSPSYYFMDKYVKNLETPRHVSIYARGNFPTISGDEIVVFSVHYTDDAYWKIMEFDFIEGRPFNRVEIEDAAYVAVITKEIKETLFGKQGSAIGKRLTTKGAEYTVIGVVENFPVNPDLIYTSMWMPYTTINNTLRRQTIDLKDRRLGKFGFQAGFSAIINAESKKDFSKIKNEFNTGLKHLKAESFEYRPKQIDVKLLDAKEELGNEADFVNLVFFMTLLFMALPALNLMNLNFNRFYERYEEIGIRKSFGAPTGTIAIQFLFEVILISLIGGAIGYAMLHLFADNIIDFLNIYKPGIKIPLGQFRVSLLNITYTMAAIIFFAVISSVLPAIRVSRLSIHNTLKGG